MTQNERNFTYKWNKSSLTHFNTTFSKNIRLIVKNKIKIIYIYTLHNLPSQRIRTVPLVLP